MPTLGSFLTKIADFQNLGTLFTQGAPGILLAFGVLLLAVGAPACPGSDRLLLEAHREAAETLDERLADVERRLASGASRRDVDLETASQRFAGADAEWQYVRDLTRARREAQSLRIPDADGEETTALMRRDAAREKLADLRRGNTRITAASQRVGALRGRISAYREAVGARLSGPIAFLESSWTLLLALLGVGWVLGALLTPVNRLVFLQAFDQVVSPRGAAGGEGRLGSPKSLRRPDSASRTSALSVLFGSTEPVLAAEPPDELRAAAVDADWALTAEAQGKDGASPEELWDKYKAEVRNHEWSYYVGRGIVSREDWEAIVTSHYRWVEAAINLVVPVTVLMAALVFVPLRSGLPSLQPLETALLDVRADLEGASAALDDEPLPARGCLGFAAPLGPRDAESLEEPGGPLAARVADTGAAWKSVMESRWKGESCAWTGPIVSAAGEPGISWDIHRFCGGPGASSQACDQEREAMETLRVVRKQGNGSLRRGWEWLTGWTFVRMALWLIPGLLLLRLGRLSYAAYRKRLMEHALGALVAHHLAATSVKKVAATLASVKKHFDEKTEELIEKIDEGRGG